MQGVAKWLQKEGQLNFEASIKYSMSSLVRKILVCPTQMRHEIWRGVEHDEVRLGCKRSSSDDVAAEIDGLGFEEDHLALSAISLLSHHSNIVENRGH